jgi:hypothetical protein
MEVHKSGRAAEGTLEALDIELINRQTIRPLTAEEVYSFKVVACDDQVDRDYERFPVETLKAMAPMFVGKSLIFDHDWSAGNQTARIYDAEVAENGEVNQLICRCYMLRQGNEQIIAAIDGGILREVSVSVGVKNPKCCICGKSRMQCSHIPGRTYNGTMCVFELTEPTDAYELSFVAVPSQRGAGVTKAAWPEKETYFRARIALNLEKERLRTSYEELEAGSL